jgi:Zn/Cd-binding protein ZinT
MVELLEDPAFEAAYPIWAEDYDEPTTPEQVKQEYEASYRTDFASMVVDDNTISFFSAPATANGEIAGEVLFTGTYTAEGLESISEDGYSYAWYKFKANEEGPYQYLLLLPPESEEEEGFTHWHYRYGSDGYVALLSLDKWWPTAVLPKTTAQEVVDIFSGK